MRDLLDVDDLLDALLAHRPQVEVVLEELAEELTAVGVEAALELVVGEAGGGLAVKERDEVRIAHVGGREVRPQLRRRRLRASASSPAFPSASRRDFASR